MSALIAHNGVGRLHLGLRTPLLIARRLVLSLLVLLVVSIAIFAFVHLAPGGPEQAIAGEFASPAQLAAVRAHYHLDDPLWTQYAGYLGDLVHGRFGTSLLSHEPVLVAVRGAAGVTVPLMLMSWIVSVLLGTALGILAAVKRGTAIDRAVVAATTVGASTPLFAMGVVITWLFGIRFPLFPVVGSGDGGLDRLTHLVLPACTIGCLMVASVTRVARVSSLQVLDEDHVVFARSRGLSRKYLLFQEILRNVSTQLVTEAGAMLVLLISGQIVVEAVFNLDGIGTLLTDAIANRDIPLIQGITLLIAAFIVLVNMITDGVVLMLDPRLRKLGVKGRG